MQLKQTIKRQLETDKDFLMPKFRLHGRANATVLLDEEPGQELITLLMTNYEIQQSIKKAVEEVFGVNCLVSNIYMGCGKRLITFEITKNC